MGEDAPSSGWEDSLKKEVAEVAAAEVGVPPQVSGAAYDAISGVQKKTAKAQQAAADASRRVADSVSKLGDVSLDALLVPGFTILVLGMTLMFLKFFGSSYGASTGFVRSLSIVAAMIATWIVSIKYERGKVGALASLGIFLTWVLVFQMRFDPLFIGIYGGVSFLILAAIAYFTHGDATQSEFVGILVGLILLADLGLGPFLLTIASSRGYEFAGPIGSFARIILVSIPWWPLFAVTMISSFGKEHKLANGIWRFVQFIAIAFFGLFFIVGMTVAVPDIGDRLYIGNVEEFQVAQQEQIAKLSAGDVSDFDQFIIRARCAMQNVGATADELENCEEQGIALKQAEAFCSRDSRAYNSEEECVLEEQSKLLEGDAERGGNTFDEGINFVEVDIAIADSNIGGDRGKLVLSEGQYGKVRIPFEVSMVVPEGRSFDFQTSCTFIRGREEVMGKVDGATGTVGVVTAQDDLELDYLCSPTKDIEGTWTVEFSVDLLGMETRSFISPIFTLNEDRYADVVSSLQRDLQGLDTTPESVPEFARLNVFVADGLVEVDDFSITSSLNIENIYSGGRDGATGTLIAVHGYEVDYGQVFDQDFESDECFIGFDGDVLLPSEGLFESERYFVSSCLMTLDSGFVSEVESMYAAPRTFEAWLSYDYQLSLNTRTPDIEIRVEETEIDAELS